jgi:hypothetical protein
MTYDDVRKIALAWPEVEDGTSYGTPALKVRNKMLVRLKEDGDSLVMPGVPTDERSILVERLLLDGGHDAKCAPLPHPTKSFTAPRRK